MPQLDGFQVLDHLETLEFKKDIYILMLTSSVSHEDKVKASEYKLLSGFESKPLSRDKFKLIREEVFKKLGRR
jgi:CheY-like chemotaxis protein